MLERGMAITRLVVLLNGSGMSVGLRSRGHYHARNGSRIGYDAGERTRGGGERRGEERSAALALAPLEVAVRGADAVLPGFELVAVHGDAHRTAGLAPLGAGSLEDFAEAFALGLSLHLLRSRDDQDAQPFGHMVAAHDRCGCPQVLDAAVRARSDEHDIELLSGDRTSGLEAHVHQRALELFAVGWC